MNTISFATGNFYRFIGKTDIIKLIDKLNVSGIEYTYGRYFDDRPISNSDVKILLKKKNVSIHLPFKFAKKVDSVENELIEFKKMVFDYNRIKAKRMVVHPNQNLGKELLSIGKKSGVQFVTENLDKRHYRSKRAPHKHLEFEEVLNAHKRFGLCLDVSHAYSWSKNEASDIIEKWGDRIMQVHFSVSYRQKNHQCLQNHSSNSFIESVQCLKKLDVPIIIEEDMVTTNINWVKREISLVKKLLDIK